MYQLRHYVAFQDELKVNYCHLAAVSVDQPDVCAAFRTGSSKLAFPAITIVR